MSQNSPEKVARRLARLEDAVKRGRVGQLRHASFEGGGITQYSPDGEQVISRFGEQYDGTGGVVSLTGPIPGAPGTPYAEPAPAGILIRWNGDWAEGPTAVAPLDFTHVEVHASVDANFTGLFFATKRGEIVSARGGEFTLNAQPAVGVYIRLVARTASGKASVPSDIVGPIYSGRLPSEAIDVEWEEIGGNTIHRQETPPSGANKVGDLWLEIPENIAYRWESDPADPTDTNVWTLVRDQGVVQALQEAFDANAAAEQAGIDALAAQGTAGTALTTANSKTASFTQNSAPSTTGRTAGDEWIDSDDGNRRYVWDGAWTATPLGAAGISATARQLGAITTYRQATAPASGMVTGDFWIDSDDNKIHRYDGTWVVSQDTAINTAITNAASALGVADSKMRIFPQASAPTGLVAGDVGDMWIDTDDGNKTYTWTGTIWEARQFGNSAIQPQSLVASDVIATGTVTAALLEAVLVLATTIIAGDPTGTHAEMTGSGFRVFREDLIDGIADEVVRMGTETNDFLGITDGAGELIGSWNDAGEISATGISVNGPIVMRGQELETRLVSAPGGGGAGTSVLGARNYVAWHGDGVISGVTSEIGTIEASFELQSGRIYHVIPSLWWLASANTTYLDMKVRDGGSGIPTINSPVVDQSYWSSGNNAAWSVLAERARPMTFTTGTHRLLLTVAAGGGGTVDVVNPVNTSSPMISVIDMGPDRGNPASVNRGGGTVSPGVPYSPPTQQYFQELAPAGWATFRGDGVQRFDVPGPVQGWDPSGYNGDGFGYWWFNVPSITGTVDHVEFYAYANHWYYNSGGTARVRAVKGGGVAVSGLVDVGGWPKPGGKWVGLGSMNSHFHNNQGGNKAVGFSVGPGGGTAPAYYGRFDGPSARMRIWFTQ